MFDLCITLTLISTFLKLVPFQFASPTATLKKLVIHEIHYINAFNISSHISSTTASLPLQRFLTTLSTSAIKMDSFTPEIFCLLKRGHIHWVKFLSFSECPSIAMSTPKSLFLWPLQTPFSFESYFSCRSSGSCIPFSLFMEGLPEHYLEGRLQLDIFYHH